LGAEAGEGEGGIDGADRFAGEVFGDRSVAGGAEDETGDVMEAEELGSEVTALSLDEEEVVLLTADDEGMDETAAADIFGEAADGGRAMGAADGVGVEADGGEGELGDLAEGRDGR